MMHERCALLGDYQNCPRAQQGEHKVYPRAQQCLRRHELPPFLRQSNKHTSMYIYVPHRYHSTRGWEAGTYVK